MFRQTWTRSNCAKAPPLCSRFRDRRLVIVETTLYPPEQRARLPSLGYLTEIRTRVAGIKSYLDSDSAGGGNFSPPPAGLGESRWWTKVQRVPTGLNSMEKCFPTRFPALRSFRCQIRGTSRNESNFVTKGCGRKIALSQTHHQITGSIAAGGFPLPRWRHIPLYQ